MAQLSLGGNVVVEENDNGDAVIKNTQDGTSVSLENFISIVGGGLGEDGSPVPGTSHFESVDVDELSIQDPINISSDEGVLQFDSSLGFGSNEGWTSYLELSHNGSDDGIFIGFFDLAFANISDQSTAVNEEGKSIVTVDNDGGFGSTGSTNSISTHLRLKVDDNDSTVAYIQVDRDLDFIHGILSGTCIGRSGVSVDAPDPI